MKYTFCSLSLFMYLFNFGFHWTPYSEEHDEDYIKTWTEFQKLDKHQIW